MATSIPTPAAGSQGWQSDPVLDVQHLTMRLGGLVAVNDLKFQYVILDYAPVMLFLLFINAFAIVSLCRLSSASGTFPINSAF